MLRDVGLPLLGGIGYPRLDFARHYSTTPSPYPLTKRARHSIPQTWHIREMMLSTDEPRWLIELIMSRVTGKCSVNENAYQVFLKQT